jgi:nucleotide-binding universal stress UspA family protein
MTWKPFVVGVDASPEAAWAAGVGARAAKAAGTTSHLVHATHDALVPLALAELSGHVESYREHVMLRARAEVRRALDGTVDPADLESLTIRPGRPATVIKQVVAELDAGMVILGGKHHSVLDRWLAGSTSIDVVRTTEVPVLIMGGRRTPVGRVLAAVDLSAAAQPTIEAAEQFAALYKAELRVLNVLEPLAAIPEAPNYDLARYYARIEEYLKTRVWPLVRAPRAETLTRYGYPVVAIREHVQEWNPDVVVVGSHGKGWVDRFLIGSATEGLLNELPATVLVIPVHAHVAAPERKSREREMSRGGLGGR